MWQHARPTLDKTSVEQLQVANAEFANLLVTNNLKVSGTIEIANIDLQAATATNMNIVGDITAGGNLTIDKKATFDTLQVNNLSIFKELNSDKITVGDIFITGTINAASVIADHQEFDSISTSEIETDNIKVNQKLEALDITVTNTIKGYIENALEADNALTSDIATIAEKITNKLTFGDYIVGKHTTTTTSSDDFDGSSPITISVKSSYENEPDTIVLRGLNGEIVVGNINSKTIVSNGENIPTIDPINGKIYSKHMPINFYNFTTNTLWKVPDGIYSILITLVGGGGGGGAGSILAGGAGGGGGAIMFNKFIVVTPREVLGLIVGQNGRGGISSSDITTNNGTNGGDTIISKTNAYIVPSESLYTVIELPTVGNPSSIYRLEYDTYDEINTTYWKYVSGNWEQIILPKYHIVSELPTNLDNLNINDYYEYNEEKNGIITTKYYKFLSFWTEYETPEEITVVSLPQPITEENKNKIFILSTLNNSKWIYSHSQETISIYKPYVEPTIISVSSLPSEPIKGQIYLLTSNDAPYLSGDTLIYTNDFVETTKDTSSEYIYDIDYDNILYRAWGGGGGQSGIQGGTGENGLGGTAGKEKTSGYGGIGGHNGREADHGEGSVFSSGGRAGQEYHVFTEELVDKLPLLQQIDITKYYTLTNNDGNKPLGSSWVCLNYEKWSVYITKKITVTETNFEDITVDFSTFDFYCYYILSDADSTIGLAKKYFKDMGVMSLFPEISEDRKIYVSDFYIPENELDPTKYYVLLNDYTTEDGDTFVKGHGYLLAYYWKIIQEEETFKGGGGGGGASYDVGGNGGSGGILFATDGKKPPINTFGGGGGGGGRKQINDLTNMSTNGANGAPGLILISH